MTLYTIIWDNCQVRFHKRYKTAYIRKSYIILLHYKIYFLEYLQPILPAIYQLVNGLNVRQLVDQIRNSPKNFKTFFVMEANDPKCPEFLDSTEPVFFG